MKYFVAVLGVFIAALLFPCRLQAQNPSPPSSRTETPYLLPQTIFVGDPGRLVVPLGQAFTGVAPFILDRPEKLPPTPDITIRRMELEHRGGNVRLLIDFVPYAPGVLSLPSLDLHSLGGYQSAVESSESESLVISDLKIQVASILSPSQMALSEPASPLAVPGTSFLIYGTVALVLVFLFLGIGGSLWGRRHFRDIWERFRRRHLLRGMLRFLLRLRQEYYTDKSGKPEGGRPQRSPGFYLTLLSGEFREFLSLFTGINCRPLTAGEFLDLPLAYADAGLETSSTAPAAMDDDAPNAAPPEGNLGPHGPRRQVPEGKALLSPAFLCGLFRAWDTLRFSGRPMDKVDLFLALQKTENFLIALDRAEKEKPLPRTFVRQRVFQGEA